MVYLVVADPADGKEVCSISKARLPSPTAMMNIRRGVNLAHLASWMYKDVFLAHLRIEFVFLLPGLAYSTHRPVRLQRIFATQG